MNFRILVFLFQIASAGALAQPNRTVFWAPSGRETKAIAGRKILTSVREVKAFLQTLPPSVRKVSVVLLPGRFDLDETWEIDESWTRGRSLLFKAQKPGASVISGGRILPKGSVKEGMLEIPVAGPGFRYLFGPEGKMPRARQPGKGKSCRRMEDGGILRLRFQKPDGSFAVSTGPGELHFTNMWSHMVCPFQTMAEVPGTDSVDVFPDAAVFRLLWKKPGKKPEYFDHFENSQAWLNEPGEWILDRKSQRILLIPDQSSGPLTRPVLSQLLKIRGTPDHPVTNLSFEGIHFQFTDDLLTDATGHHDVQANFSLPDSGLLELDGDHQPAYDEYKASPASVEVGFSDKVVFKNCRFSDLAHTGVRFGRGVQNSGLAGCRIERIMGNGIEVGGVEREDHHPSHPENRNRNNFIRNCTVRRVGEDFTGSVGIFGGYTEGLVIAGNEISDLPYTGISLGWGWGSVDTNGREISGLPLFQTPSACRKNRVDFNQVHHVMQLRRDGAGIYTLGSMPESRIHGNYLHHNLKANDVYLDEYSSGITVDSNLVESVGANPSIKLNNPEKGKHLQIRFKDNVLNNSVILKKKEYEPPSRKLRPKEEGRIRKWVMEKVSGNKHP
jgi:hypothetical protein